MTLTRLAFRIFLPACFLTALIAGLDYYHFLRNTVEPPRTVHLSIVPGTSFGAVAHRLQQEGVIASALKFKVLAHWRDEMLRIQAGEYAFEKPADPEKVLGRLVKGDVILQRLTLPEGWTLREIAARLEQEKFAAAEQFLEKARDPDFIRSLEFDAPTLEGYLFPDTYALTAGMNAERLLKTMVAEFRSRVNPDILQKAEARGLNLHQLTTLASIVQKEAGNREEMPLIASVFHNRLRKGIPLQADPTVIYGIEDFDGNLTRAHLTEKTPYNTYAIRGLPPGPIANPGEDALRAAADPAETDFLYFVSRGDGTHVFSRTLKEHNRAVRKYQLRRGK